MKKAALKFAARNKTSIRYVFSVFVLVLIVAPIPPSTIIGLAMVANRKTNRFIDQRAVKAANKIVDGAKGIGKKAITNTQASQMKQAEKVAIYYKKLLQNGQKGNT